MKPGSTITPLDPCQAALGYERLHGAAWCPIWAVSYRTVERPYGATVRRWRLEARNANDLRTVQWRYAGEYRSLAQCLAQCRFDAAQCGTLVRKIAITKGE